MSFVRQFILLVTVAIVLDGTHAKPPRRVVGGEDGEIGEFPYTTSIRKKNRVICGGTIISDRHILTAAHCVDGVSTSPWKDITVVTGTNSVSPGAGTSHVIKNVTVHPEYSNNIEDSWRNDIAIITLEREIVFGAFAKSARLPDQDTSENWVCVASGWGDMSFPKGIEPNNIRKAVLMTLGNDDCQQSHKVKILNSHLCAYKSVGVGLCSGDSGGPLVYNGTVIGIASFVTRCAKGNPDVFTRVYSFIDFIHQAMSST